MQQGKGIYYTHIQLGIIKTTVVLKEECRNQSGYGKYEHNVYTQIHIMSQKYELPVNTNSLSGQQHQQLGSQYYFLAMSAKKLVHLCKTLLQLFTICKLFTFFIILFILKAHIFGLCVCVWGLGSLSASFKPINKQEKYQIVPSGCEEVRGRENSSVYCNNGETIVLFYSYVWRTAFCQLLTDCNHALSS